MYSITALAAAAVRRVAGERSPVARLRRHHAYRHARMDPEQVRQARATWWGADGHWFPAGTPPRRHNQVTPLIDGMHFFRALQEALAQSQDYVYLAGWCLSPYIPLDRHDPDALLQTRLLTLLSAAATRVPVRVLLWSGAPILLQPSTRTVRAVQAAIEAQGQGDLQCRLDDRAPFTHCHHQKAIVVDGQIAFVGGMDLTTFAGDRWDTPEHPLRAGLNWHDVQVRLQGEVVADVEQNFRQRWAAVTGETNLPRRPPVVDPSWNTPVQIVRTIARDVYPFAPQGEFGIRHAYLRAIRQARHLIYLENQYLWSPEVMRALIAALDRPHSAQFRIVLVLPAQADDGKWDNDKHVARLRRADRDRGLVSIYSLYASGPDAGLQSFAYRPIYLHAKVGIFDDEWFTVGSANLNERGFATDSEINALVHDPGLARDLRLDLWAEHLGLPRAEVAAADPIALIDHAWPERAAANARIIGRRERPLLGAVHRYAVGHMLGSPVLEDAESLTFEH